MLLSLLLAAFIILLALVIEFWPRSVPKPVNAGKGHLGRRKTMAVSAGVNIRTALRISALRPSCLLLLWP